MTHAPRPRCPRVGPYLTGPRAHPLIFTKPRDTRDTLRVDSDRIRGSKRWITPAMNDPRSTLDRCTARKQAFQSSAPRGESR